MLYFPADLKSSRDAWKFSMHLMQSSDVDRSLLTRFDDKAAALPPQKLKSSISPRRTRYTLWSIPQTIPNTFAWKPWRSWKFLKRHLTKNDLVGLMDSILCTKLEFFKDPNLALKNHSTSILHHFRRFVYLWDKYQICVHTLKSIVSIDVSIVPDNFPYFILEFRKVSVSSGTVL